MHFIWSMVQLYVKYKAVVNAVPSVPICGDSIINFWLHLSSVFHNIIIWTLFNMAVNFIYPIFSIYHDIYILSFNPSKYRPVFITFISFYLLSFFCFIYHHFYTWIFFILNLFKHIVSSQVLQVPLVQFVNICYTIQSSIWL